MSGMFGRLSWPSPLTTTSAVSTPPAASTSTQTARSSSQVTEVISVPSRSIGSKPWERTSPSK